MIAISNIMLIFALPYINSEWETASILRADFLCPHLNQYWYSTPSWTLNGATAPSECKAEGKAVPLFILQPIQQIICNALHRINLFASEKQYLTSNALCSDMHRIHAQPLQQRRQSLRSAVYLTRGHSLSRSHKNPFQEDRTGLCGAGKKKPANLFGKRIYSTERRTQLHFIIQLSRISATGVMPEAWSSCGQTKKAVAGSFPATAANSYINF
ncbi:MAG: hypothetical protein A2071_02390 [Bacteroidetes bacterium GWC1_47_7]|nr:MAG: hypothetical protein A2071_02390 [Bacteroidetes bacterium GWC1_47_7]